MLEKAMNIHMHRLNLFNHLAKIHIHLHLYSRFLLLIVVTIIMGNCSGQTVFSLDYVNMSQNIMVVVDGQFECLYLWNFSKL
jgi:hypothetical protein